MPLKYWLPLAIATVGAALSPATLHPLRAQAGAPIALAALGGQVSSSDEGPMEGVLVSAEKNATITVTVVSDRQGRYRFPASRLEPGQYALRVRATGYELDGPTTVDVAAQKTTTADLKLRKSRDLASQLTNAEWLSSFPGTDAQKASIRGCTHCHTLERIARTTYDADRMVSVIERMSTYPQLSFPLKVQKLPAPRVGGGQETPEQRLAGWRRQAEYLASINLSGNLSGIRSRRCRGRAARARKSSTRSTPCRSGRVSRTT
jgi:virginiamycin B lyase